MSEKTLQRKMDRLLLLEDQGKLKTSNKSRTLRKILSNRLAVVGVVLFAVILILCFLAPLFTKYEPNSIDLRNRLSAPSRGHLMGTDQIGRDSWTRILYGGRISIFGGLGSAVGAA